MNAETTLTVDMITRRKRRRLRPWMVWSVLLLCLAAGLYWYGFLRETKTATVHYVTTPSTRGDITVIVTAVGIVQPTEQVEVGSLISGTISEVRVVINDKVTKGEALARLDTSSLEAELARDQAPLTARKAEVEDARAAEEAARDSLTRAQKT
ncbi:MAG: biotin/lipoyl-binding protein, partial [Pseudorhodobacter sp.]|nr:biotin/lipoyl-binding protein [Pseudorhodobacter sp.]